MEDSKEKVKIIVSMLIWSTLGIFVKQVSLNSMQIAFFRAIIGSGVLFLLGLLKKEKWDIDLLKKNLILLILSGIALGTNWVFLFQGFKYTTIANATLSYYFAPIFIAILSFLILKERLSTRRIICIIVAMIGLVLILKSGSEDSLSSYNHIKGILYGLSGAVFYAIVVLLNKFIKGLSDFKTTLTQLFIASMVLLPFIIQDTSTFKNIDIKSWILILLIGIIHTSIPYLLYFSAIRKVNGQSVAILSYIDPIFAVIISSIFLRETMSWIQILGGILILISTYLSEAKLKNQNKCIE